MKHLKIFLILSLLLTYKITCGDIIIVDEPESRNKSTNIFVRIVNIDKFPDIVFIGVPECVAYSAKPFQITSRLNIKVYDSCKLYIYAVKKEFIKDKNIKQINWSKEHHALRSEKSFKTTKTKTGGLISRIEQEYRIAGFTDTSVVIYKSSQTIKYYMTYKDSIATFKYNGDISKLKKSF